MLYGAAVASSWIGAQQISEAELDNERREGFLVFDTPVPSDDSLSQLFKEAIRNG